MFFKRKITNIEWIVAGLGNPGKKYDGTRHNVGFEALDIAATEWGIAVKRAKFDALCGDGVVNGHRVLLMKPQTFMNLSGPALMKAADYYDVPAERVVVLCDDVALTPGVLRIRLSGSAGGHNGLKSIITFMGEGFARVRIGVGDKPRPDYDMADWVLSRLSIAERKSISARYMDVAAACALLMEGNADEAMSLYNGLGRDAKQK